MVYLLFLLMVDLFFLMVDLFECLHELYYCTKMSSIVSFEYPRRMFAVGKSASLRRSLHHNCKLGEFEKIIEAVGEEVYNDIMNNHGVGVILKLATWKMIWAGRPIESIMVDLIIVLWYTCKLFEMFSIFICRFMLDTCW